MKEPKVGPTLAIVLGVTELAWMFERSRYWAADLLRAWEREQQNGGPRLVFRRGRALYTTMPVVHARMPPGRDMALYRRVEAAEGDIVQAHRRIDLVVTDAGEIKRRVTALERTARARAA